MVVGEVLRWTAAAVFLDVRKPGRSANGVAAEGAVVCWAGAAAFRCSRSCVGRSTRGEV